MKVTEEYLKNNPEHIFVFGDNLARMGTGGAAALRHCSNTYGFVTKKYPSNHDSSFYEPLEYFPTFARELHKLQEFVTKNPTKTFLISKLGAGLANKFGIYEKVILPGLQGFLSRHKNVIFLKDD